MHVVATAGHVDHGKSALVRALTGMEPDRWAEERRRGMTIDLGYAWTELPSGREMAFVDVPGHERFVTNMLAGVGPVPAVLLVVAADGGWSAQTEEHVAAIDALRVRHGVLAVTRADLADPGPALAEAAARLAPTGLAGLPAVATSAVTGRGLDDLRAALDRLADGLPPAPAAGRVRLWIDRVFTVAGFGTVVTGTLGAGTVSVGDTYELGDETVVVRGLERLGRPADAAGAPCRVAVNLRAAPRDRVARGQALLTPGAWLRTTVVDAAVDPGTDVASWPRQLVVHVGSAAVAATVRPLGPGHVRLGLRRALPLQIGDRLLVRDPGRRVVLGGVGVVDPEPPLLTGRGATRRRAEALAGPGSSGGVAGEVRRRGALRRSDVARLGLPAGPVPDAVVARAGWLVAPDRWEQWRRSLLEVVAADHAEHLVRAGVTQADAVRAVGLPDAALLAPLVASCPTLELGAGRVRARAARAALNPVTAAKLAPIAARHAAAPFDAPTADEVTAAGLSSRELAAAAAAGDVVVLAGDVVVGADAVERAGHVLDGLAQPFTLSEARVALATSRRVAVPLLEHLDRIRRTRRIDATLRVTTRR